MTRRDQPADNPKDEFDLREIAAEAMRLSLYPLGPTRLTFIITLSGDVIHGHILRETDR